MPHNEADASRKRKTHKKSRGGCSNCKLRRVKCDEQKPKCEKCISYGVSCDYNTGTATDELHMAGESAFHAFQVTAPPQTTATKTSTTANTTSLPTPPNDIIFTMLHQPLALHDTNEIYHLTETDLDTLHRFHTRTVLTIGTAHTIHIYQDHMLSLSCAHAFLTHTVLALTLMHDRYLSDRPFAEPTTKEAFHSYHATALFNAKLSEAVRHEEKDALWGTAALLGCMTIAAVNTDVDAESWPLCESSPLDLNWLRMSEGKKAIWRLADPLRADSVWEPALRYELERRDTIEQDKQRPELDGLYPFFVKYFEEDGEGDEGSDPYATAASILVRLLGLTVSHDTILYFLSFIGHMDPAFRRLLHEKDKGALLLLTWWWAKMCEYPVWWLQRRARLECRAICLYLAKEHARDVEVVRLLEFPKVMCGLGGL